MIRIEAVVDGVTIEYAANGSCVSTSGSSLTEAVENLVARFAELQQDAIRQLRDRGFIRVEPKPQGEVS